MTYLIWIELNWTLWPVVSPGLLGTLIMVDVFGQIISLCAWDPRWYQQFYSVPASPSAVWSICIAVHSAVQSRERHNRRKYLHLRLLNFAEWYVVIPCRLVEIRMTPACALPTCWLALRIASNACLTLSFPWTCVLLMCVLARTRVWVVCFGSVHSISFLKPTMNLAYLTACNNTALPKVALTIAPTWDGPTDIILNTPATVVVVGFGAMLAGSALYLLSSI